jgi:hypothetical protein
MTGTLTGTRGLSDEAERHGNARERLGPFPQVENENATGTHENAAHGNAGYPPFRGVPVPGSLRCALREDARSRGRRLVAEARRHARGLLALIPGLEAETHHEPDHDDQRRQTEEDEALSYLRTKIVRLFADAWHVKGLPDSSFLHAGVGARRDEDATGTRQSHEAGKKTPGGWARDGMKARGDYSRTRPRGQTTGPELSGGTSNG